MVVGRDEERAALRSFIDDPQRRSSAAHLFGESGIGKTTLLDDVRAAAEERGMRVLSSSPSSADAEVPLLSLADLIDGNDDVLEALPAPQRSAMEAALERSAPASEDRRLLVLAVHSFLDALGHDGPFLVTIDDLQWVDQASARIVRSAVRRSTAIPIRLALAWSTPEPDPPIGPDLRTSVMIRIPLPPLTAEQIGLVLQEHGVPPLPLSIVTEVAATSGGNPFYALEMAAALLRHERGVTGHQIPIPASLRHDVVSTRVGALSTSARELVLAAAASARPTVSLLAEAADLDALSEAVDAGIIDVRSGQVRFLHPVLREVVLSDASRSTRHRVHRRLSELVRDPDLRAWHVALGVDVPDERLAGQLERASRRARAAGARRQAATLSGKAVDLSPAASRGRPRRARAAAYDRLALGELDDALALTREIPGHDSDRHLIEARTHEMLDRPRDADAVLTRAIGAERHPGARAALLRARARARLMFDPPGADADAREACDLDPSVVADAARLRASLSGVAPRPELLVDLSVALVAGDVPLDEQPLVAFAEAALVDGRPSRALAAVDLMTEESLDPIDSYLMMVLKGRALVALGDLQAARGEADGAAALASSLGFGHARDLTLAAEIAVAAGHEDAAGIVARACEAATAIPLLKACALAASGIARLARREPSCIEPLSAAADIARRAGIQDPGFAPYLAEEAEALALAKDPSAETRVAWLESRARELGRPNLVATAARCRASLLAGDHRHEAAAAHLRHALATLEGTEIPLDRARILLALGSSLRRSGRKAAARDALQAAEATFDEAGAGAWVAAAREEVSRIGGRRRSGSELSDAERSVARLAAAGRQNREIAAELYLSVRTVESHLSNAFSKLGVRSRTELAALLSSED